MKILTQTADLSLRVSELNLAGKKLNSYYSVQLEILNMAKSLPPKGVIKEKKKAYGKEI